MTTRNIDLIAEVTGNPYEDNNLKNGQIWRGEKLFKIVEGINLKDRTFCFLNLNTGKIVGSGFTDATKLWESINKYYSIYISIM